MKQKIKYWAFFAFTLVLALVFTVLKLTGVIAWSWFWVVSPVVIPLVISVVIVSVAYYSGGSK